MRINLDKIIGGNRGIWLIIAILFMFSVLSVYSASVQLPGTNTTAHLFKHVAGLLLGVLCIYLIHKVPCRYFRKLTKPFFWLTLIGLIATMLFAPEVNGAKRWIRIGILTLQPSDFAKLGLIMYLANKLSLKGSDISSIKSYCVDVLLPILLTCILIMPSNLSTALLVFVEAMVLVFFSGVRRKYFWGSVGVFAVAGVFFFGVILYGNITIWRFPTWKARVESFVSGTPSKDDPEKVQVATARMAVASGGIIGRGPGNGHAKVRLANAHCDYIYANITEEYGILGATIILWLYIMLFVRAISIVKKINKLEASKPLDPKYKFRQYLVVGLTAMIVIQAMSNILVAVDFMPVTGQTLPFVSYGTSSLFSIGLAIGVILSVSREVDDVTAPIASETEKDGELNLTSSEEGVANADDESPETEIAEKQEDDTFDTEEEIIIDNDIKTEEYER